MNSVPTTSTVSPSGAEVLPWWQVLTPALLVGFGVLVLTTVGILIVGLANLRQVHATGGDVAKTYSVKVAMQQLLTTMADAETGERGFIITSERRYLEPYDRASSGIDRCLRGSIEASVWGLRSSGTSSSSMAALSRHTALDSGKGRRLWSNCRSQLEPILKSSPRRPHGT